MPIAGDRQCLQELIKSPLIASYNRAAAHADSHKVKVADGIGFFDPGLRSGRSARSFFDLQLWDDETGTATTLQGRLGPTVT